MEMTMLEKLWAFFFGGEVEQQVVVVNAATLQDAYEFRRRLYADVGDEVPTRIQVEEDWKTVRPGYASSYREDYSETRSQRSSPPN